MLTVFVRSVILFAAAVLSMRVMGKRQVGQLQPFEMVVVIMIAELAATPMGGVGIPLLYGILPMAALVVCHSVISWLCMKSVRLRALISGRPTILIQNGVVRETSLRRMSLTMDDLMEAVRTGGVQDIGEVGTAVLETSGKITVFPRADKRALTPEDMGMKMPREGLPLPLILDGQVNEHNLRRAELTRAWLRHQVERLGYAREEDVLLLCVSTSGMLLAQGRGKNEMQQYQALSAREVKW